MAKTITTKAAARLWRSYQKSFAFVASTRSVNDALEKGCTHRQTSFCISEEETVQEAARRFVSEGVGSLIATNRKGKYMEIEGVCALK
jgi:predicted transcriptional regulator